MLEDSENQEIPRQLSEYEERMEIAERAYNLTLKKIASYEGDDEGLLSLLNEFYTYLHESSFYQAEIYKAIKEGGITKEGINPFEEDIETEQVKMGEYETALIEAGRDGNYSLMKDDFDIHLRTLDEEHLGDNEEEVRERMRNRIAQLPNHGTPLRAVTPSFMQERFVFPPEEPEEEIDGCEEVDGPEEKN